MGALLFCFCATAVGQAAALRQVWQPNGPVEAMLLRTGTLYIAGTFSSLSDPTGVSQVARSGLAAIDWATGVPTSWNPGANGTVYCMANQGSTIYAGGSFSYAGGITANAVVAIDVSGNSATAWNPGANGAVRAIQVNGTSVFIGGNFSYAGGASRTALAELNATSPTATAFNAGLVGAPATVRALALNGNNLFVGGSFTSVSGSSRNGLAAVNKITGALGSWLPASSFATAPSVYSLFVNASALWVGGNFTGNLGGQSVNGLSALNLSTAVSTWAPAGVDLAVQAAVPDAGGRVHVGGTFANADSLARRRFATYYQSIASVESTFSADLNVGSSDIRALLANGSEVALGGQFTQVDAQNARNLVIVSLPALGSVPTATPLPTAVPTTIDAGAAPYVFPQPGRCATLKAAIEVPLGARANLKIRSIRGTLLKSWQAPGAGSLKLALDCAVLEPGLYWLETNLELADGSTRRLPSARFVVLQP